MGFLDKLKDSAAKLGDSVEKGVKSGSESIKKAAEKSNLKKEIGQLETGINDVYIQIGKKFAEANPDNAEYLDFFNDIKDKLSQIETLKAKLVSLEDKIPCSVCGEPVSKDAKFCDKCGAKVELPVVPAEEAAAEGESAAISEGSEISDGTGE
jgi:Zn finger protein HypA/HybF involved in hydrogenase expression